MIKNEQVINIIDSVVTRPSFGGERTANVNIKESVVQRPEFKSEDSQKMHTTERKIKSPGIFTKSISMEFVLIPKGEVIESSIHINKPYYLSLYPVTQREWKQIMENNPSHFEGSDLPIECVSWLDVQRFINKLNEKEGLDKYRLPSEAEWKYAACAGTNTRYFFGDDESHINDYVWYRKNSGSMVHQVGQKKPNQWGLYDMLGNVWEFVQDENNNDCNKISKGGSWRCHGWYCSPFEHQIIHENEHFNDLSFRLVKDY